MIETMVDLGDPVEAGQPIARIWPIGRTGLMPQEVRAKISGLLVARHFPGLITAGDCAGVVGVQAGAAST